MTLYMRKSFDSSVGFDEILRINFGVTVLGGTVPLAELCFWWLGLCSSEPYPEVSIWTRHRVLCHVLGDD